MSRFTTEKNAGESRSSTTERTISNGLLLPLGCGTASNAIHEIVGRLFQTPIQVHRLIKAFQKNELSRAEQNRRGGQTTERAGASKANALQLAAILLLMSFLQVNPSRAAEIKIWEEFSGEKALAHVQRLVNLGPHPAGSEAIDKARDYIEEQLRHSGWQVTRQAFTDDTPRGKIHFVNLIARFTGDGNAASPSLLLCSHYDTKIFDDIRFVGANDGGSSTGLLIELACVLAERPLLASKIELVFFDGEEAVEEFTDRDGIYGSRYFASELLRTNTDGQFHGGILFDMVGDKSLNITMPVDSPPRLARGIFGVADALKCREHFTYFDHGNI